MQNILGDTNEKCITLDSCVPVADGHQDVKKLLEPHVYENVLDLTDVLPDQLVAPQITSTPISSNIAIPLPWYTEDMQEILLQTKEAKFQETSQSLTLQKKNNLIALKVSLGLINRAVPK